jgi:hypothetical protein
MIAGVLWRKSIGTLVMNVITNALLLGILFMFSYEF